MRPEVDGLDVNVTPLAAALGPNQHRKCAREVIPVCRSCLTVFPLQTGSRGERLVDNSSSSDHKFRNAFYFPSKVQE